MKCPECGNILDKEKVCSQCGYWKCSCGGNGRNCGCSEYWRDIKEGAKEHRDKIALIVMDKLKQLNKMGFRIRKMTEWQIRINDRLDIFWQSRRYHDIKLNKRGDYKNLISFVKGFNF